MSWLFNELHKQNRFERPEMTEVSSRRPGIAYADESTLQDDRSSESESALLSAVGNPPDRKVVNIAESP